MERHPFPTKATKPKRPRKRFGSKKKGGKFEREISRSLSLWVTAGKRDDVLWRTAGSGSMATRARKKGKSIKTQFADIASIDREGDIFTSTFLTELKHYRNLGFGCLLRDRSSDILKVWHDMLKLSVTLGKHPLMILRQNGCKTLFCVRDKLKVMTLLPVMTFHRHRMHVYYYDEVKAHSFAEVVTGV